MSEVGSWTGELIITVGDERLRVLRTGPPRGGPVVLLWGGLGSVASDWDAVLARLDPALQMVWIEVIATGSDWVRTPVQRRAQAILIAAETLRLQPPYLLAGHSLGGLYVQGFARLHPALTAGLLLVDSTLTESREAQRAGPSGMSTEGPPGRLPATALAAASLGLRHPGPIPLIASAARRLFVWGNTVRGSDPLPLARSRRSYGDPAFVLTILRDWAQSPNAANDLRQMAADHPLPDVPLTVLAGSRRGRPTTRHDHRWLAAQRRLSAQAPGGRFLAVHDAAHLVMLDRPDAVATALHQLLHDDRRQ